MAAASRTDGSLTVGPPVALFTMAPRWSDFDVDQAGRFLAVVMESRSGQQPLTVVINWLDGIAR